jgi:hypothetical protein
MQEVLVSSFLSALEILPAYCFEEKAEAAMNLGGLLLQAWELDDAEPYLKDALEFARASGRTHFEAVSLAKLASLYVAHKRFSHAIEYAKAAQQVAVWLGGAQGQEVQLMALELLARIRSEMNDGNTEAK